MPTPLVRVSYKNVSGSTIPPFGIVQFKGSPVQTATNDYVFQADKIGKGTGPCFIDTGKGATSSGEGQYGSCVRVTEGFAWLAYDPSKTPATPWVSVGGVVGQFYASEAGGGFLYAGKYDSSNHRILCLKETRGNARWAKTTSAITAGSTSSPTQFTVNVWIKSGSTWPYTQAVTTESQLLGLSVVNRLPGLTNSGTGVMVKIEWDDELSEYTPVIVDC